MHSALQTTDPIRSIYSCALCENACMSFSVCVQTCRSVEPVISSMATQRRKEILTLVVVFTGVLLLTAFAVYYLGGGRRVTPEAIRQEPRQPDAVLEGPTERASPVPAERISTTPQSTEGETFVDRLFGTRHSQPYFGGNTWLETIGKIALRLFFAALLSRPRLST